MVSPPPRLARRWTGRLVLVFLCFCLLSPARAQIEPDAEEEARRRGTIFNLGIDAQTISGARLTDVRLATRLWIQELGEQMRNHVYPEEVSIHESTESLARSLRENRVDLCILNALTYLELDRLDLVAPALIIRNRGKGGLRLLLLARHDLPDLTALRGKTIILGTGGQGQLPRCWLQRQLKERDLPQAADHFSEIREAKKPSKALLPLFFGKADACIIDESAYETMVELNPQLETTVHPLARSEELVTQVLALRKNYRGRALRRLILEQVSTVRDFPKGRQLMTLFQIEGFTPYADDALDSVRRLAGIAPSPGRIDR